MLRNAFYIGKRGHRGEVIGGGDWPPLVDRLTFERAKRLLDNPTRWTRQAARAATNPAK